MRNNDKIIDDIVEKLIRSLTGKKGVHMARFICTNDECENHVDASFADIDGWEGLPYCDECERAMTYDGDLQ
jgi:hypothetical protein